MPRAAIVLQARTGSRRLPRKVLATITGRSMLAHCIERLRRSGLPLIVATTEGAEDDSIEAEARAHGVAVVRGPADDVLSRFALAAGVVEADAIVRATADNPGVDIDAPLRVLAARSTAGADYATEDGLPYGAAVEAFTVDALLRAAAVATDAADREHVTTLMRRDARFRSVRATAPAAVRHPMLRLTVDTADDLAFMRQVVALAESAGATPAPLAAIIAAAVEIGQAVARGR